MPTVKRDYIKPADLTDAQTVRVDSMNEHVQRNPYGAARRLVFLEDLLEELHGELTKANAVTTEWLKKVSR